MKQLAYITNVVVYNIHGEQKSNGLAGLQIKIVKSDEDFGVGEGDLPHCPEPFEMASNTDGVKSCSANTHPDCDEQCR